MRANVTTWNQPRDTERRHEARGLRTEAREIRSFRKPLFPDTDFLSYHGHKKADLHTLPQEKSVPPFLIWAGPLLFVQWDQGKLEFRQASSPRRFRLSSQGQGRALGYMR